MPTEIERKFLVTGTAWRSPDGQRIVQGYLNRDKARTVRVRIAGAEAEQDARQVFRRRRLVEGEDADDGLLAGGGVWVQAVRREHRVGMPAL